MPKPPEPKQPTTQIANGNERKRTASGAEKVQAENQATVRVSNVREIRRGYLVATFDLDLHQKVHVLGASLFWKPGRPPWIRMPKDPVSTERFSELITLPNKLRADIARFVADAVDRNRSSSDADA
jgi:hypothetical protein